MNAALDMDSVTFDPSYKSPAVMAELNSNSLSHSVVVRPKPFLRTPVTEQRTEKLTLTDIPTEASDSVRALTLADLAIKALDPRRALALELGQKAKHARAVQRAYKVRIEALIADVMEDSVGLNVASEDDFWHFIRSEPLMRKGHLVLVDNGNLRAVWRGENGSQVALQFLGARTIQYVIFKRRTATGEISRGTGRDSFEGVKRQIDAFDLRRLIYT